MKCPTCSSELKRILYEGLPVFRCMKCHGYLLGENRVEGVKRARKRTAEQLKRDVAAEAGSDTEETIRCPRCRRKMRKRFLKEPAALHLDVCPECEHVWFDGGELARMQLTHEISAQGRDAAEHRRRIEEMTPEAKAEFQRNLSKLKKDDWSLLSVLRETVVEALMGLGTRPR